MAASNRRDCLTATRRGARRSTHATRVRASSRRAGIAVKRGAREKTHSTEFCSGVFTMRWLPMVLVVALLGQGAAAAERPNILWFIVDDMSANFSCYGEKTIATPHVDRLAREGTMFSRAFITAPVCSPCRSALITGMYQTSIGAH